MKTIGRNECIIYNPEINRKMKNRMTAHLFTAILIAALPFCETLEPREQEILRVPQAKAADYEQYLVDTGQYTTRGKVFHDRYRDHLIGIARIATEKYKLAVQKNSIGFYHDKKAKDPDRLYLGFDFRVEPGPGTEDYGYGNMVGHLLRKHIQDFIYITQSCGKVFVEKEIVGSVVGINWERSGRIQHFNFWIEEKEAALFEGNRITLTELIERNTITNAEGLILRLKK